VDFQADSDVSEKRVVSMFRDLSEEGDSMFLRNAGIDQQIHKHQNPRLRHITVRISNLIYLYLV
jgi:hypothetical protein